MSPAFGGGCYCCHQPAQTAVCVEHRRTGRTSTDQMRMMTTRVPRCPECRAPMRVLPHGVLAPRRGHVKRWAALARALR